MSIPSILIWYFFSIFPIILLYCFAANYCKSAINQNHLTEVDKSVQNILWKYDKVTLKLYFKELRILRQIELLVCQKSFFSSQKIIALQCILHCFIVLSNLILEDPSEGSFLLEHSTAYFVLLRLSWVCVFACLFGFCCFVLFFFS